jgi:integrase
VFPWHLCESSFYHHYGKILRRAGLPDERKTKSHCIRVSHASWREAMGGDASKDLGHADRATTQKHYLDPRIARTKQDPLFWPTRTG